MSAQDIPQSLSWDYGAAVGSDPVFLRLASTYVALIEDRIGPAIDRCARQLMAGDPDADDAQVRFLSGMRIGGDKPLLLRGIVSNVGRLMREYCELGPKLKVVAQAPSVQAKDMRILDDRDVAETLTMESAAKQAEGKYLQDVHALGVRLGALASRDPLELEENPTAPRKLLDAFNAGLLALEDLDIEQRVVALEVFGQELLRELEPIYDHLNKMLAAAGIEPNLKWEPRLRRERERQKRILEEGDEAALNAQGTVDRRLQSYLEGWLHGSIQWLLSRRRQMQGDKRDEHTPGIDSHFLKKQLDALQRRITTDPELARKSIDEIKSKLREAAAEAGIDEDLSLKHENALDAVGMMFDFVNHDESMPEPFRAEIHRLQVPFLKAAIQDPDMFGKHDHPAKTLLNNLAEASAGWNPETDRGNRMVGKLREVVDHLIEEFGDDPAVLEKLSADFESFLRKQRRRSEVKAMREREAMAGQERLSVARHEVASFLSRQTRTANIPGLVDELLRRSWAHVMVLTALQHGKDSPQWKRVMGVARELVWSSTVKPEPESVKRLKTRLPVLGKALAEGLRKVGYGEGELRNVMAQLKKMYAALVKGGGDDQVIVEYSESGLLIRGDDINQFADDPRIKVVDDPEELVDILGTVRDWRPGQWIEVSREEGARRMQLSWISPITGRYLFVDQTGQKADELTAHELAEAFIAEQLKLVDDEALSVRALTAVASRLQESLR